MSDATLLQLLLGAVALAVLLLLLAVLGTGLRGKRRVHLGFVACFLPVLAVAVYLAEAYGRRFRFDPNVLGIHLALAWSAVIALLGPIASGLLSLRRTRPHPAHRIFAFLFTALAVAAVATGAVMIAFYGERLPE